MGLQVFSPLFVRVCVCEKYDQALSMLSQTVLENSLSDYKRGRKKKSAVSLMES